MLTAYTTSWKHQRTPLALSVHMFLISTVAAQDFSRLWAESRRPTAIEASRAGQADSSGTLEISPDRASLSEVVTARTRQGTYPPSPLDLYLSYGKCFHGTRFGSLYRFFQWNKMCCTSCVWNEMRGGQSGGTQVWRRGCWPGLPLQPPGVDCSVWAHDWGLS